MPFFSTDQRVCWREGICVSPQHFQLQEQYFEAQLQRRLQLSSPLAWGVHKAQFDQSALSRGEFTILDLEALLPDGSAVSVHAQSEHQIPSRTIATHFDER